MKHYPGRLLIQSSLRQGYEIRVRHMKYTRSILVKRCERMAIIVNLYITPYANNRKQLLRALYQDLCSDYVQLVEKQFFLSPHRQFGCNFNFKQIAFTFSTSQSSYRHLLDLVQSFIAEPTTLSLNAQIMKYTPPVSYTESQSHFDVFENRA